MKKNPAYNLKELKNQKRQIDDFIANYNRIRKTKCTELNPLINKLDEEISLVRDHEEYEKALEELKNDKIRLSKEFNNLSSYLTTQKSNSNQIIQTADNNIKEKSNKIAIIQQNIDDIKPSFNILKERVTEKASDREGILKILDERKNLVNQAREVHRQHQEKRRSIKAELRTKLGIVLAKKQQLIDDEIPLIKALEDAESQVKEAQESTSEQLALLQSEREKVLAELDIEKEQYQIINAKATKITKEKENIHHEIGLNQIKHERQRKEIINAQSAIAELQNIISCRGIKDNEDLKMLEIVDKQIEQRLSQIESLKKEIIRLSSVSRVTQREIVITESNNQELNDALSNYLSQESELTEKQNEIDNRRKVMKETISAYRRLKNALSIPEHSSVTMIASKAIELVRLGQARTVNISPAPQRVTPRMIEDDLDMISQKIANINARIAA